MKKVFKQSKVLKLLLYIALFIIVIFGIWKFVYPENLNIKEWETLTDHNSDEPFTVQCPKGWIIKPGDPMKEYAYYKIYSPWDYHNNLRGDFVKIDIDRGDESWWSGVADDFLNKDIAILTDNSHTFIETKVDGYRTLIGRHEIDRSTYAYIFTPTEIIRFELAYDTDQNPKEVIDIFHKIVKSFKLIKKTNL